MLRCGLVDKAAQSIYLSVKKMIMGIPICDGSPALPAVICQKPQTESTAVHSAVRLRSIT
jgi:hypothetical protein